MTSIERLVLTGMVSAKLGPQLVAWGVPQQYQSAVVGYVVAGIPIAYHLASIYVPRILARWFPPVQTSAGQSAPKG